MQLQHCPFVFCRLKWQTWHSRRERKDAQGKVLDGGAEWKTSDFVVTLIKEQQVPVCLSAQAASLRSTSALTRSSRSDQHLFTSQRKVLWLHFPAYSAATVCKPTLVNGFVPSILASLSVSCCALMYNFRTECQFQDKMFAHNLKRNFKN